MIKGIKQSDKELLPVIQEYGCLFLCFANASPLIFEGSNGRKALNKIWTEAEKKGYISGDLNHDGDYDDSGEAEIQNHTALANEFFALSVKYDGKHHKADEKNAKIFWWNEKIPLPLHSLLNKKPIWLSW